VGIINDEPICSTYFDKDFIDLTKDNIIPTKRAYPERCDAEFCGLVQYNGIDIPFTTFDFDAYASKCYAGYNYYGEIF
jgi:hypothetical protein